MYRRLVEKREASGEMLPNCRRWSFEELSGSSRSLLKLLHTSHVLLHVLGFLTFNDQVQGVRELRWGIAEYQEMAEAQPLWYGVFGYIWDQDFACKDPRMLKYQDCKG